MLTKVIKYSFVRLILCSLILLPLQLIGQGSGTKKLLFDEHSAYNIIIPNEATPSEAFAAKQLQKYISLAFGANFNISQEKDVLRKQSKNIYVGMTSFCKKYISAGEVNDLGGDGILIKSIGDNLIISGGGPRGTLNAVFFFLERFIEIHWWTPNDVQIPKLKNAILPEIDIKYRPPFDYREHFIYSILSHPEFASVLRENGDHTNLSDDEGGSIKILGFVHTFAKILPASKYFSSHPEWFSDPNNGGLPSTKSSKIPNNQSTQLCLTNEQLYKEFLKNTLEWIRQNPSYNIISISQNDSTQYYCRCSGCQSLLRIEGEHSGVLLRFINKIASAIKEEYPEKKIVTLAYSFNFEPPKVTRPDANVIMMVAPISANFAYPLTSSQNSAIEKSLIKWSEVSRNNYYWGYNTNFRNLFFPYPSFYHVGEDLAFLAEHHYKGVFLQDNIYSKGVGFFLDLKTWVIGHLLWNPFLNQDSLISVFANNYYGSGGKYLVNYIKLVDDAFLKTGDKLSTHFGKFDFITLDLLNEGSLLFKNALDAVKNNKVYTNRILQERISLDFEWLYFYDKLKIQSIIEKKPFLGPADYTAAKKRFFSTIDSLGVPEIDRYVSIDQYRSRFMYRNYTSNHLNNHIIRIQQNEFKLYKVGQMTSIVKDSMASDGYAVQVLRKSKSWVVQVPIKNYSLLFDSSEWNFSASIKLAGTFSKSHNSNSFVYLGYYDENKKTTIYVRKIPLSSLSYKQYTIASSLNGIIPSPNGYFYLIFDGNAGDNDTILIDYFELKKIS